MRGSLNIEKAFPESTKRPLRSRSTSACRWFSVLSDYEREDLLPQEQQPKLEGTIAAKDNILAVSRTGTGKTTLAKVLTVGGY